MPTPKSAMRSIATGAMEPSPKSGARLGGGRQRIRHGRNRRRITDNDGDVDIYLTNYGPDALYRNEGDGTLPTSPTSGD